MRLKSHINRCCQVSPNMLFKAPTILRELHLSVSPMYQYQVPTLTEGVTLILAARCSPIVLSKYQHFLRESLVGCLQLYCQSTNILLRELYLFSWLVSKSASWGCFTCLLSLFPSTFTWGCFTCLLSNLLALLLVFCHTSVFI